MSSSSNTAPGGRILIVEDDADLSRMLRLRLTHAGFDVTTADAGASACASALEFPPDVVLLEEHLPDLSGREIIKQLKAQHPWIECIILLADPSLDSQLDALDGGAFDVLVKPFQNLKLVVHKVRSAVSKSIAVRDYSLVLRQVQDERDEADDVRATLNQAQETLAELNPEKLTGIDALTGVINRDAIIERFQTETSRALRYSRPLSIATCSIDGLELVLERYGADSVKEAFCKITSLAQDTIRDIDYIGRYGDAELLFIFPETDKERGLLAANRLRSRIESTPALSADVTGGDAFALTVSLGVSSIPHDTMNADELLDHANEALEQAKREATNQARGFTG